MAAGAVRKLPQPDFTFLFSLAVEPLPQTRKIQRFVIKVILDLRLVT